MLEWKQLYTEAIINALNPIENVLEIGFGYAAECIQSHHPKTHTIIESNPQIIEEARRWANLKPNVKIVEGKWETALPSLGTFDAIFFNDYRSEQDMVVMNFLFPESTVQTSVEAKYLLGLLEQQMSQMTMQFSDQDIEDFFQKIGQFNLSEMPVFFQKLQSNGNISKIQYENIMKKYPSVKVSEVQKSNPSNQDSKKDNMLVFLLECLKNHINKNGRFSTFLSNQVSKYEDSNFFDAIITNPDIDYKESSVPINTSDKIREALIMLVEKSS